MPYVVLVMAHDMADVRNILHMNHPDDGTGHKITAVYKIPDRGTATCNGACGSMGWRRSQAGYTVHTCGRRVPWAVSLKNFSQAMFDRFGKNLLSRKLTPQAFQNPEGY